MTTKDMERKALAQIRKIVEGLGENSYIGMAFEGCFEVAEQNIEYDWGCSLKDEIESQQKMLAAWDQKCKAQNEKIQSLTEELDEANKKRAERDFMAQEMANRKAEAEDLAEDRLAQIIVMQSDNENMKNEILHLKAKLYDLMVK